MPDVTSRSAAWVEPLTRREREILPLLAEGLTGPEIAERLTLATSSVKTHLQHLYGKLGANSKRQAVSRARELGLLDPAPGATAPPEPTNTDVLLARLVAAGSGAAAQHNLPQQLTSFVGRRRELDEARRRLRRNRLLTLTGPGGTGKTRLAQHIAAECLGDFKHGAWLVELAPLAAPALVAQAVAQTLALDDQSGQPTQRALSEHLRDKTLLLILDNCEHLVAACAELAEALLRAAPALRILATSREALGVTGESSYPVPALAVPEPDHPPTVAVLAQAEAVQLFVERAAAVRPDFALTADNAADVVQICRRLDGIPLAIELAAARTRALTAAQIAARLDNRFGLLTAGSRTAQPRHQTLRGAIDWSYDLLSPDERRLLRGLAVFAGGWSLEAAEQASGVPETLDLLSQLVTKSLVLAEQRPGQEGRFRLLETVREYAQEKLAEAGEAEAAQDRHLAFYVALAEEAEPALRGHGQLYWLNRLDQENDNLRAALAWAVERGQAEPALRLASALVHYWHMRGFHLEGHRWLEAALKLPAGQSVQQHNRWRAKALVQKGWLPDETDNARGDNAWLAEGLRLYRELGDKAGIAAARLAMAVSDEHLQHPAAALQLGEEVMELVTAAGDHWSLGACLRLVGRQADNAGNRAQALAYYQRAAALLRELGDRWHLTTVLNYMVILHWLDGEAAQARALVTESLAAVEAMGGGWGLYLALSFGNVFTIAQGDYARARAEALIIQNAPGRRRNTASGWTRLGQIDYLQGRLPEARAHLAAALLLFRELNDDNGLGWVPPWLGCVAYRAGDLDQAQALIETGLAIQDPDRAWTELAFSLLARGDVARAQGQPAVAAHFYGRSLRLVVKHRDQPDVAGPLEGFAKLAGAAGQAQRAARLFGAAEALRVRIGLPIPPIERADYDGALAQTRGQLDEEAFLAAWAEGLALGWEDAAKLALEE